MLNHLESHPKVWTKKWGGPAILAAYDRIDFLWDPEKKLPTEDNWYQLIAMSELVATIYHRPVIVFNNRRADWNCTHLPSEGKDDLFVTPIVLLFNGSNHIDAGICSGVAAPIYKGWGRYEGRQSTKPGHEWKNQLEGALAQYETNLKESANSEKK